MAFDHEETAKVERKLAKERAKKATPKAERKLGAVPEPEEPTLQRCLDGCHYDLHPGESLHRGVPEALHEEGCSNADGPYVRHDVEPAE